MAAKDDFASYCADLLAALGPVRVRRMFGGHGIYVDGVFIAIVAGETLYLKADAESAARFEAAGCAPFLYTSRGRTVNLGYRAAPPEAMDSPALMRPWASLALQAAIRTRARAR